jgi:dCTP deaminase
MILTGKAIQEAWESGDIHLEPFSDLQINPNSYNFRLSPSLFAFSGGTAAEQPSRFEIPEGGYVLRPGLLYLGVTDEVIGSRSYVMTLLGRSSLGRLGLFLNVTADLGHVGASSRWTLELTVVQPLRVYPRMRIGQVAFWEVDGDLRHYTGRYLGDFLPVACRDHDLITPPRGLKDDK